ncbi:MAG: hypothetical protein PVJ53_06695 [Desulfobacterales bacterium]|jgi:hypothetical protein
MSLPIRRLALIALIAALPLILIACPKVSFTETGNQFPAHAGTVKILNTYPSDSEYDEIGWVSADGDFNTPWSELLGLMQKEAAKRGANAIVLEQKFTTQLDTPNYSVGVNQRNDIRSVTAVAIRVK